MAQQTTPRDGGAAQPAVHRFGIDVDAGAYFDAYDRRADGSDLGLLLRARLGYAPAVLARHGVHVVASLAYARTGDVATHYDPSGYAIYGNRFMLVSAGAKYDVHLGRARFGADLEVGHGWRAIPREGQAGTPSYVPTVEQGYSNFGSFALGHVEAGVQVTQRTALMLGWDRYYFDTTHPSQALTAGVSFR